MKDDNFVMLRKRALNPVDRCRLAHRAGAGAGRPTLARRAESKPPIADDLIGPISNKISRGARFGRCLVV
jgi:hypothetical protein